MGGVAVELKKKEGMGDGGRGGYGGGLGGWNVPPYWKRSECGSCPTEKENISNAFNFTECENEIEVRSGIKTLKKLKTFLTNLKKKEDNCSRVANIHQMLLVSCTEFAIRKLDDKDIIKRCKLWDAFVRLMIGCAYICNKR